MNEQSLKNLLQLIHASGNLLTGISIFSGIAFGLAFLYQLLRYGKQQGMASSSTPGLSLLLTFVASALLLRFGVTIHDLQSTFTGDGTYPVNGLPTAWSSSDTFEAENLVAFEARMIVDLFSLIGAIGIYRAVIMLPRLGRHDYGRTPATMGTVLAFAIGGTAMIRVSDVASWVGNFIPLFSSIGEFLKGAL